MFGISKGSYMDHSVFYQPLDPFSFLERISKIYPDKEAIVYKDHSYSYARFRERVNQLSGALKKTGIQKGDRVAYLLPNVPQMIEGHFGPLGIGSILVPINTRLSSVEIEYIINHSGAKLLVFDSEFSSVVKEIKERTPQIKTLVQVVDNFPFDDSIPSVEYEAFIADSSDETHRVNIESELDTISINYTSGTTGSPKGVQIHARGAYLNALGEIIETSLNSQSKYLWTLPMFHCNGWCNTWAVTAVGGTHICIRTIDPKEMFDLINKHSATHMCAAPTVLIRMYSYQDADSQNLSGMTIATGGAPPATQVIKKIEAMGAEIMHVYGLTETFGPYTLNVPQHFNTAGEIADKSKQGFPYIHTQNGLKVFDPNGKEVPADGESVGEIVMRSNGVMSGYFKDETATRESFRDGWFHSGDLAVMHPDGQIEIKDRIKDVIISGGENISSQEIESVIMEHPDVLEVAVVAIPDDYWGEVPKAFVTLKLGSIIKEETIIEFCKKKIARFKAPKHVEFCELPKTATGKIQKFSLRENEWKGNK